MNSENELRVAVAGFGTMGRKHTVNCTQIDGVRVVAVAVLDEAEGAVVKSETDLPFFTDASKMLAGVPVDAFIVATPPGVRRDMVNTAIAAGTAVFIEKPIALNWRGLLFRGFFKCFEGLLYLFSVRVFRIELEGSTEMVRCLFIVFHKRQGHLSELVMYLGIMRIQ